MLRGSMFVCLFTVKNARTKWLHIPSTIAWQHCFLTSACASDNTTDKSTGATRRNVLQWLWLHWWMMNHESQSVISLLRFGTLRLLQF
jgi:hypothetical protein